LDQAPTIEKGLILFIPYHSMAKGRKNRRLATTSGVHGGTDSLERSPFHNLKNGLLDKLEKLSMEPLDGPQEPEEAPPRLLALQEQLEKLDADRYMLQQPENKSPAVNSANTEASLQLLKKRLGEVRQQLYGTAAPSPTPTSSLANLAKSYFGGMIRGKRALGGFPGEGEAFDEDGDEFELEISEGEYFEEELLGETNNNTDRLLDATRLGLKLFGKEGDMDGISPEDYELVTRAEAELDAALDLVASPAVPNERKMEILREKFDNVIKQDLQWRSRVSKVTRVVHDERIQRQLVEMELDKANAIKHRLESLCRDLHNENRKIKAEKLQAESAVAELEKLRKEKQLSASASVKCEFPLPSLPEKAALAKESSAALADRILFLADLFLRREEHFAALLRLRDSETISAQEKVNYLADQLSKQTSLLDGNSRRITLLTRSEQDLKAQVRQYVEKFRQVEETLGKSNDLFGTFRAEMEQMGAKLARLERENAQLNSKCATLSRNIIEMADERTKQNAQMETMKGQKAKLEQLCRTLQAERNAAQKSAAPPSSTTPLVEDQKPSTA